MMLPAIPSSSRVVVIAGLEGPELIQHCLRENDLKRSYLVIDVSGQPLAEKLRAWDLSAIEHDPQFIWSVSPDIEEFSTIVLRYFNSRKKILSLSSAFILKDARAFQIFPQELHDLLAAFAQQQKSMKRLTGFKEDGLAGLDRLIENLDWAKKHPGVDRLRDVAKGLPAVVASTGPSLTKSLPDLKNLQNKAVIIAPDASLKALLAAGIYPHFVCSLERDLTSKPFFENLAPFPAEAQTHLVAYTVVPKPVIDAFPGPSWVSFRAYRQHGYFEAQLKKGILLGGHSVSHMCVSLADRLGCSPIVLVGQDLAFDPDRLATHAENTAYADWSLSQSEEQLREKLKGEGDDLYWLPGNTRERVPTRAYYVVFAREFGVMARDLKSKLINSTDGGLKIPFLPWIKFTDVIQDWKSEPSFFEKIRDLYLEPREPKALMMKPLLDHLQKIRERLAQNLQVAHHLQTDVVKANLLKTWKDLEEDHVVEGFGLEILGDRAVELMERLGHDPSFDASVTLLRELDDVLAESQRRLGALH